MNLVRPIDLRHPIVGIPLLLGLFAVTWFEPLSILGVKFAVLWRAALIIPTIIYIYAADWTSTPATRAMRPLMLAWLAYACAPLLSMLLGLTTFDEGLQTSAQRIVPLTAVLLVFASGGFVQAEALLRAIPFFLCLVAPFMLSGLIAPTGTEFSLDHLGAQSAKAYIGTFQNQHSAALAHSIGALIAWDVYARSRGPTALIYLAATAGCVVLCFFTTARAGIAGLLIGMAVIAIARRQTRLFVAPLVGFAVAMAVMVANDPQILTIIVERLLGKTIYQDAVTLDSFTSGRIGLQAAAVEAFSALPPLDQLFGIGAANSAQAVGELTGSFLMAHNVFLDELLRFGLLGLAALLVTMATSHVLTWRNFRHGYPLGYALWFALIVFAVFQSLDYSFQLLLVGCVIALDTTVNDVDQRILSSPT